MKAKTEPKPKTTALGRPLKLNQELIDQAYEYMMTGYEKNELFPTIQGMALWVGVGSHALDDWARKGKAIQEPADERQELLQQFSTIYQASKDKQAVLVIRGVMKGDYNAPLGVMLLTHNGFSKAIDVNVSHTTTEKLDFSHFTPAMHEAFQDAIAKSRTVSH